MMGSDKMETTPQAENIDITGSLRTRVGRLLIIVGLLFLADLYLKTGWLTQLILPVFGIVLIVNAFHYGSSGLMVGGSVLTGLGLAGFVGLSNLLPFSLLGRIGAALLAFGLSWCLITLFSTLMSRPAAWWALIPAAVITGAGLSFFATPPRAVDFTLYIVSLLGAAFLAWGLVRRLFGLIIPGSLLGGIGPGIYIAWGPAGLGNGLARTGIMLVSFALGWGLITLFSRRVTHAFVWWPLIPGGVLAMVGWGLYIGGNPSNAAAFIGNTGSIALILFGIYLVLLRRGISR